MKNEDKIVLRKRTIRLMNATWLLVIAIGYEKFMYGREINIISKIILLILIVASGISYFKFKSNKNGLEVEN